MLLSVQNHLFGAQLCHSSGMRQYYMNFYLKIQIYRYPICLCQLLFVSDLWKILGYNFSSRILQNDSSLHFCHFTNLRYCNSMSEFSLTSKVSFEYNVLFLWFVLNINDYVKCSIESTFQNKLLFLPTQWG